MVPVHGRQVLHLAFKTSTKSQDVSGMFVHVVPFFTMLTHMNKHHSRHKKYQVSGFHGFKHHLKNNQKQSKIQKMAFPRPMGDTLFWVLLLQLTRKWGPGPMFPDDGGQAGELRSWYQSDPKRLNIRSYIVFVNICNVYIMLIESICSFLYYVITLYLCYNDSYLCTMTVSAERHENLEKRSRDLSVGSFGRFQTTSRNIEFQPWSTQ